MQTVPEAMLAFNPATQAELDAEASARATLADRVTTVENTNPSQKLTATAAQATTSGTAKDFTGIPSWAKRITIVFNGVSANGTSPLLVQAITGVSTVVVAGYAGSCNGPFNASPQGAAYSTGFRLTNISAAADVIHGQLVLTNIPGGNTWTEAHTLGYSSSAVVTLGGGSIALGAVLTGLRITATNGTDAFDAGAITVLYE
jgi:hypothetical protein